MLLFLIHMFACFVSHYRISRILKFDVITQIKCPAYPLVMCTYVCAHVYACMCRFLVFKDFLAGLLGECDILVLKHLLVSTHIDLLPLSNRVVQLRVHVGQVRFP